MIKAVNLAKGIDVIKSGEKIMITGHFLNNISIDVKIPTKVAMRIKDAVQAKCGKEISVRGLIITAPCNGEEDVGLQFTSTKIKDKCKKLILINPKDFSKDLKKTLK